MLIQCEKCQTRYNLDEAKIPGKGAKVTCPTCKNVFVVMKDGSQPHPGGAAPAAPPPPQGSAPKSLLDSFFDDGKTVAGMFPGQSRGPAPGAPAPSSGRGLKSWKVRVASGLVYDFTDPSTLKSWIAEKKVTPADAISEDGMQWTVIGSLPTLDAFFGGASAPEPTDFGAPGVPPVTGFGAQPVGSVPAPFIPPSAIAVGPGPSLGALFGAGAPPAATAPFPGPSGADPFGGAPPTGASPFGNPFGGGAAPNPFGGDPFASGPPSAPAGGGSPFASLPPPPPPAPNASPFAPPPPSPFPGSNPFGAGGAPMTPGGDPFANAPGGPPSIAPPPFAMGAPKPAPPPWASAPPASTPPPPMFGGSAAPPPPAAAAAERLSAAPEPPPDVSEPRGERRIGRTIAIGASALAVAGLAGAIFLQKDVIWTALRPPPLPTATATPPPAVATLEGEARTRYLVGRRYLRIDDVPSYEKATEAFRAALAGAPANPRAAAGLLESLALRRSAGGAVEEADLNGALGAASSALKEDSRGVETNRALAQYYATTGKPEQALGYLETAIASRPDDAESLHLRSTLRAPTDPAGAKEDLVSAAREPDLTRAHRALVASLPAGTAERSSAAAALLAIEKANAKVREALDANVYAFDAVEVERLMPGEPAPTPVVIATVVETPAASPVETAVAVASVAPATPTPAPAMTPAATATATAPATPAIVAATATPAPTRTAVAGATPVVAPTPVARSSATPRSTSVAISTPVRATPTPVVARTATPAPTAAQSDTQIASAGAEDFYLAGIAYQQAGSIPDAIEQYRAAVAAAPRNTKYQLALGAALMRAGQRQEAAEVLARVRDREPSNPEAHRLLGMLFESTGQNAEACAEFGDYLRLAPTARDATDVRARLVRNGC